MKTRRGYGRKNARKIKQKTKNVNFSLLGTNAAGLNSKRESLYSVINLMSPSVMTVQETKFSKPGMLKIPGYQVFEKVRKMKKGGGLLTAADEDLNPVLISTGEEDNEIITIEVNINEHRIRIINGYGPQEDEDSQRVLSFWQEIESEVMKAKDDDCLIQMDANAKVGKEIIKDDPNQATNNGKLMLDIIERQKLKIAKGSLPFEKAAKFGN